MHLYPNLLNLLDSSYFYILFLFLCFLIYLILQLLLNIYILNYKGNISENKFILLSLKIFKFGQDNQTILDLSKSEVKIKEFLISHYSKLIFIYMLMIIFLLIVIILRLVYFLLV
jgi:hypothetical protein